MNIFSCLPRPPHISATRQSIQRTTLAIGAAATLLLTPGLVIAPEAGAQSSQSGSMSSSSQSSGSSGSSRASAGDESAARLVDKQHVEGNLWKLHVWSPSHGRTIENIALLPDNDLPRPHFYLLPGWEGGQGDLNWAKSTNYEEFFAGKQVGVVTPLAGNASMFTDWQRPDPILGTNMWTTYLTQELPQVMDAEFNGTGTDAVAGVSMSGGAALDIAGHAPERFKAAASFSGCPATSTFLGRAAASSMITGGGGSSRNAWGGSSNPAWQEHDPSANPERLAGTNVFVSAASGEPGNVDIIDNLSLWFGPRIVEIGSRACTDHFVSNARQAGVNVTYYTQNHGAHSFGLFADELYTAWRTTIGPTLGVTN